MRTLTAALLAALFIIALTQGATASSRDTKIWAEGKIEIHSKTEIDTTAAAYKVTGEGSLQLDHSGKVGPGSFDQGLNITMVAADKPLRGMEAISAVKSGKNYFYAIMAAPDQGADATLDASYRIRDGDYKDIDIAAEVFVSAGEFRNYINIYNPASGMSLEELMKIIGAAYYQDKLTMLENNGTQEE